MHEVGDYQSCRTQSRVARSNCRTNHAKNCNYCNDRCKPSLGNKSDHSRTALASSVDSAFGREEICSSGCPDESHNTFGNHCTIENRTTLLLVYHTTSHKRRLRSMETRNCTASDGYEHHREYRICCRSGVFVFKSIPNFGNCWLIANKCHHYRHSHTKQQNAENRINASDDLVNWQQCGYQIVNQNYSYPDVDVPVWSEMRIEQSCWRIHKYHTDENHQYDHKAAHKLLHAVAKVVAVDFGKTATLVTQRNHSCKEIVNGTSEDATEHNPQK